jgi:hypothetical protein
MGKESTVHISIKAPAGQQYGEEAEEGRILGMGAELLQAGRWGVTGGQCLSMIGLAGSSKKEHCCLNFSRMGKEIVEATGLP